jgi:hypothetical protein
VLKRQSIRWDQLPYKLPRIISWMNLVPITCSPCVLSRMEVAPECWYVCMNWYELFLWSRIFRFVPILMQSDSQWVFSNGGAVECHWKITKFWNVAKHKRATECFTMTSAPGTNGVDLDQTGRHNPSLHFFKDKMADHHRSAVESFRVIFHEGMSTNEAQIP